MAKKPWRIVYEKKPGALFGWYWTEYWWDALQEWRWKNCYMTLWGAKRAIRKNIAQEDVEATRTVVYEHTEGGDDA